jgi:gliding motility-associated-like protein
VLAGIKVSFMILKSTLFLFFVIVINFTTKAQNITTQGKEFYVSFFRNAEQNNPNEIKLFLTSSVGTTGNLTNPNTGYNLPFSIVAGTVTVISIPFTQAYNTVAGIVKNTGLIINSADTISVYALSSEPYSSDAALVIQKNALGNDYLIASYRGMIGYNVSSCFLIEATENNTDITITPSVNTSNGNASGLPFTIVLNKGQTYYVKAENNDSLNADLSGSIVSVTNGCKPIAVFTGNELVSIPDYRYRAGDILYEQLFPVNSFGKQFITATLKGRNVYRVKVYAVHNNTQINIDGVFASTVNSGKFYEFESPNQPKYITTSKPVQVVLFGASEDYDKLFGNQIDGDPTMMTIPPLEQQLKESIFLSPAMGAINTHKVSIVCKTADANSTLLDGVNIGNSFAAIFGNPVYSHAALDIAAGQHKIINNSGFIAYSYGFGSTQGYGYCTGASVEKINTYFTCNQISSIGNPTINVCTGIAVFDIITSETNNTTYMWDFGDGSPILITNGTMLQQSHSYLSAGNYVVKLTTTNAGINTCVQNTTTITQITLNVASSLIPSLSLTSSPANPICIGSTVSFVATAFNGGINPSYQWKVNGINVGSNSLTFTSSNLANNDNVDCTLTTNLSCASNTAASASLIINQSAQYAPNIAITTSANNLCIGYPATFTATSLGTQSSPQYQWKVNGIISGGNNSSFTYIPSNGDVVLCVLTTNNNNCGATNTAISNSIIMSVSSSLNALVNITASQNPICADSIVTFTALPAYGGASPVYQWKLNGSTVGTNSAIYSTPSLKNNDIINCIMTSNSTCAVSPIVTSNSIIIQLHSISLGIDTVLCKGNVKLLDATTTNSTYLWQDNTSSPTYLVTKAGKYFVSVNKQGCMIKDTINIAYNLKPMFSIGNDAGICMGSTLILNPQISGVSYLWQDGSTNPTYTVIQPGLYSLTATNTCGSTTDDIIIVNGVCNLYVPNSFSPNGDAKNDVFKASYGDNVTQFHLQVFNRYGQIIFETKDKNKGWDGTFKGTRQPYDGYVWLIQYKTAVNNKLQKLQGSVLLIR